MLHHGTAVLTTAALKSKLLRAKAAPQKKRPRGRAHPREITLPSHGI
jgi:hypothetical protein